MKISKSSLLLFLLTFIACNSIKDKQVEIETKQNSKQHLDALFKSLNYPLTNQICPSDSNYFIFFKKTDEYRDSWIYIITENDSFVKVEYRLLPSFNKTGFDNYNADTMQFAYYESYQLNIKIHLWNKFIQNNVFQSLLNNHTDTLFDMNMGFGAPNYLFWYNGNLHVCNSDLNNKELFINLEDLINEQIYSIIELRKNNPIGGFEN